MKSLHFSAKHASQKAHACSVIAIHRSMKNCPLTAVSTVLYKLGKRGVHHVHDAGPSIRVICWFLAIAPTHTQTREEPVPLRKALTATRLPDEDRLTASSASKLERASHENLCEVVKYDKALLGNVVFWLLSRVICSHHWWFINWVIRAINPFGA